MSKDYKISIIVPVFNVENYIRESLESIISQTIGFENLEVIMVNDCSTDNSGEIIDEYAERYENFKAIHLAENSGVGGKPRNIGIQNATGKYIMFLDPDDVYGKDICEMLYYKIVFEGVDIVSGSYQLVYPDGRKIKVNYDKKGFHNIESVKVKKIDDHPNLLRLPPSIWAKIFKTTFLIENKINFPENSLGEDFVFFIQATLKASGIVFLINFASYYYRINEDSISFQGNLKNIISFLDSYLMVLDIFKRNNKEYYFLKTCKDHLGYFLQKIVSSNLNDEEIMEIFNKSEPIFEKYKESELVPNLESSVKLFELLVNDEKYNAISLIHNLRKN